MNDGELLTVLEFFAVGNRLPAVLFRAIKGGGQLPLLKLSTVFKVHLSLFSSTQFFITHLTLSTLHERFVVLHLIHLK